MQFGSKRELLSVIRLPKKNLVLVKKKLLRLSKMENCNIVTILSMVIRAWNF